jgi:two-component system cell cycle sensor histidine kinase/response regulator CckA
MPKQPRVLVVDDDEAVRGFTERVLEEDGYEVLGAEDGAGALTLVERQAQPFDLCVIDLMMPTMRGDVLAAMIRRAYPDVKVLYFTGFGDDLFKQKHILWAHEAYLDKPASVTGLQEAVSLLLYGHIRGPNHQG